MISILSWNQIAGVDDVSLMQGVVLIYRLASVS